MFDRAQSDAIGVILLTGILTVTITGAGGVVLTEWQSDIGPTPLADIDSEITPVEMTLEHLGGDPLAPNETTVVLVGSDAKVNLEERFEPGETESWAFDRLDGPVELRIVDDQSGETIYSRSHAVENPVEDLILAVDGWTEPVYLLEDYPANYTVEQEFEQGVPADVTGRANITVDDDSQLTVDEAETTIEGTDAGFETTATVEVDNRTTETDVQVLDTPQQLQVRTLNVSAVDLTSLNVTGELANLDDLPAANLSVSFAPLRPFNGEPGDNGDNIVSSGPFVGSNYTVDSGIIHDNKPIEPGTTRTYTYELNSGSVYWTFRDSERTIRDGSRIDYDIYKSGPISVDESGRYRIELTLSEDGQTADIVVYDAWIGGSIADSDTNISVAADSDLYLSTYHNYGGSDRLTSIFDSSDTTRVVHDPAADTEGRFSEEISGLDPNQSYAVNTYAKREHNDARSTDSGSRRQVGTEGPTVDTVAAEATGIDSINVTGEFDLGTATQANLSVGYTPVRSFNGKPGDNGDNIVSSGPFVGSNYTIDSGIIHDNKPIEPGTTRTYTYELNSGSVYWTFRDSERTIRDGSRIDYDIYKSGPISVDESGRYRIELTLSEDGQTADIVVYDAWIGGSIADSDTNISVAADSDLYLSTYHNYGGSDRLTSIFDSSDTTRVVHDPAADTEGRFSEEISGLDPNQSYAVNTYAKREHNDARSTDSGSRRQVGTEGPTVDTVAAEATGSDSITVTGKLVDLGTATQANLSVGYTPFRSFNGEPGDNGDNIISTGPFVGTNYTHSNKGWIHDNKPIEPGTTRSYTYEYISEDEDDEIRWVLRDSEQTTRSERRDTVDAIDEREISFDQPGAYRIELTLSEDGQTADVAVYDESAGGSKISSKSGIDVSSYSDLYFTTFFYLYGEENNNVHLTGVYDSSDTNRVVHDSAVESTGTFSEEIFGLNATRSYAVITYAERQKNGQMVSDTGSLIRVDTEDP